MMSTKLIIFYLDTHRSKTHSVIIEITKVEDTKIIVDTGRKRQGDMEIIWIASSKKMVQTSHLSLHMWVISPLTQCRVIWMQFFQDSRYILVDLLHNGLIVIGVSDRNLL